MFRKAPTVIAIESPSRTQYVKQDVHEHRAPTDESVRLLKEFEEKAQDKVVQSVHVGDSAFECVIHKERDCMSDSALLRAVFSLNGRKESVQHSYRPRGPQDEVAAYAALRDKVASAIATKMISAAFMQMQNRGNL